MADREKRWASAVQIARLSDDQEDVRSRAHEEILRMGVDAVPMLVYAIDGGWVPEKSLRFACDTLAEIKPRFAEENPDALIEALESESSDVSHAAFRALVNFGTAAAAPLLAMLTREGKEMHELAANALALIAKVDPSIMPAVVNAMDDENWDVRSAAVKVLLNADPSPPVEAIAPLIRSLSEEKNDRIVRLLERFGSAAIPALLESLRSPDWRVRAASAKALGLIEIGRKVRADREAYFEMGVVPALADALVDQEVEVMRAAGDALSIIGPPETNPAIPTFLNILRERKPLTFRAAASEMGWIPNTEPGLEPELIDALADTDAGIRASAADLLGRIDLRSTSVAVPPLLRALNDESEEVRFEAAAALAGIAPEVSGAGVPILHAVLAHGGGWTYMKDPGRPWEPRQDAVRALARHGAAAAEAVPALIDALSEYWLADIAADALGRIGPLAGAAVPALLQLLGNPDEDIRNAAARALASIGPEAANAAVAILMERLRETGEVIRGSAADCLAEIGLPAAEVAIPALTELMSDESGYIRHHAAWALKVLGCDVPDPE